jgi:hypothetical protein
VLYQDARGDLQAVIWAVRRPAGTDPQALNCFTGTQHCLQARSEHCISGNRKGGTFVDGEDCSSVSMVVSRLRGRGGLMIAAEPVGELTLAWAVRSGEVAAELTRSTGMRRGQLGQIERECATLRSRLSRRAARHRLGPPLGDLADQLMMAVAAARRRLDVVEHQCDDVVIRARRVQQPARAVAMAGHVRELAAELEQQAASARAGLALLERECESLHVRLDQLLLQERSASASSVQPGNPAA